VLLAEDGTPRLTDLATPTWRPAHWRCRVDGNLRRTKSLKTFVGRAERGFDFLGYRFTSAVRSPAPQTNERSTARMAWLTSEVRARIASGHKGGAGYGLE
jgi:hypothetical protein